jgi:hypothetical protein
MEVIFSVLLISAILGGYYLLWQLIVSQHGPAWRLVREARLAVVVRRAAYDLDREYEELCGADGHGHGRAGAAYG